MENGMLDVAFKDFKAKKSRAVMCIIGVMACVLLIGVINMVLYDMQSGLKGDLGTVNGKLYFEQNGTAFPPAGSVISESLGDQVLNSSGVDTSKSTEALFAPLTGSITYSESTPVMVVGLTPGKEQSFIGNATVNGSSSLVGEGNNAVIIGSDAAKTYNVTVGSTLTINGNQFKIVGVMDKVGTGFPLTIDNSLVMPLSYAQNVSDRQGLISTVIIVPNSQYSMQTEINNLENSYPKYDVYSQKDAQQTINNNLAEPDIFMNMIIVMIFAVSTVLIMNMTMMTVKEKTKDIGTMRALGTKKKSIMLLIVYESLILSSIGGIIGILLISPVYNVMGLMMGATSLNFTMPFTVLLQVILIIFVIGTLSGLLPAYMATKISPIEALRYE
jgi:putative ABC transport system permease protein